MQFKKKLDSNTLSIIIGIALPVIVLVVLYFMGVFGTIGGNTSKETAESDDTEKITYDSDYYATYDDSEDIVAAKAQLEELIPDGTEISIYVYVAEDEKDERIDTTLTSLLEDFDNISLTYIDSSEDTEFRSNYPRVTLSSNDVIVTCGKMYKILFYGSYSTNYGVYLSSDFYTSTCDDDGNYTGDYSCSSAIVGAVDYVLSDETIVVYELTGHDETDIDGDFSDVLDEKLYMVLSLDLAEEESVPSNCKILFIHAPQTDLSDEELAAIKEYYDAGGRIFIDLLSDYWADLTNFNQLLSDYGITATEGTIFESDADWCYESTAYYLMPYVETTAFTDEITGGSSIFVPYSLGVNYKKLSSYLYTVIAKTSNYSYAYGDEDYTGPYNIVVAVKNTNNGCMIVSGSSYAYLDTANEYAEGTNATFFSELLDALTSL